MAVYVEYTEGVFCARNKVVVVDEEKGRRGYVGFGKVILPCVGCVGIREVEGVGQTDR